MGRNYKASRQAIDAVMKTELGEANIQRFVELSKSKGQTQRTFDSNVETHGKRGLRIIGLVYTDYTMITPVGYMLYNDMKQQVQIFSIEQTISILNAYDLINAELVNGEIKITECAKDALMKFDTSKRTLDPKTVYVLSKTIERLGGKERTSLTIISSDLKTVVMTLDSVIVAVSQGAMNLANMKLATSAYGEPYIAAKVADFIPVTEKEIKVTGSELTADAKKFDATQRKITRHAIFVDKLVKLAEETVYVQMDRIKYTESRVLLEEDYYVLLPNIKFVSAVNKLTPDKLKAILLNEVIPLLKGDTKQIKEDLPNYGSNHRTALYTLLHFWSGAIKFNPKFTNSKETYKFAMTPCQILLDFLLNYSKIKCKDNDYYNINSIIRSFQDEFNHVVIQGAFETEDVKRIDQYLYTSKQMAALSKHNFAISQLNLAPSKITDVVCGGNVVFSYNKHAYWPIPMEITQPGFGQDYLDSLMQYVPSDAYAYVMHILSELSVYNYLVAFNKPHSFDRIEAMLWALLIYMYRRNMTILLRSYEATIDYVNRHIDENGYLTFGSQPSTGHSAAYMAYCPVKVKIDARYTEILLKILEPFTADYEIKRMRNTFTKIKSNGYIKLNLLSAAELLLTNMIFKEYIQSGGLMIPNLTHNHKYKANNFADILDSDRGAITYEPLYKWLENTELCKKSRKNILMCTDVWTLPRLSKRKTGVFITYILDGQKEYKQRRAELLQQYRTGDIKYKEYMELKAQLLQEISASIQLKCTTADEQLIANLLQLPVTMLKNSHFTSYTISQLMDRKLTDPSGKHVNQVAAVSKLLKTVVREKGQCGTRTVRVGYRSTDWVKNLFI